MYTIIIILSVLLAFFVGFLIGGIDSSYYWSKRLCKKLKVDGYNEASIIIFLSEVMVTRDIKDISLSTYVSILNKALNKVNKK